MPLDLPKDVQKGELRRTAHTPADYWSFKYQGFTDVDGPAVAEVSYEELTPGQKAARTRAENDAKKAGPDTDIRNQAGDANDDA